MAKVPANWKSPPQGYPYTNPLHFLRVRADYQPDTAAFVPHLTHLFRQLVDLLGDHAVDIHASIRPEAWKTDIPWRQVTYGNDLTLPLSALCRPSYWRRILKCQRDETDQPWIRAYRGGGKYRHLVWNLGNGYCGGNRMAELLLAARHVHERRSRALERLILDFLATVASHASMVGGFAERYVAHHANIVTIGGVPALSYDRWMNESLRSDEYEVGGLQIPNPHWLTVLTPDQLAALGGGEALMSRAQAAGEAWAHTNEVPSGTKISPIARIEPLPKGAAAVVLIDTHDAILWRAEVFDGPLSEPPMLWFTQELAKAGLLAASRHDRFDRYVARTRERVTTSDPHPVRARRISATARRKHNEYLQSHPPRCIQSSGEYTVAFPLKQRFADNAICFQLKPSNLARGMPIYGAVIAEKNAVLGSPLLVGALTRDRAVLAFDDRIHGFDGEQNEAAPERARLLGALKQLQCPKCAARLFEAWAIFETLNADPDEWPKPDHPEDYFTWFWLVARCASCKWSKTVADIECA